MKKNLSCFELKQTFNHLRLKITSLVTKFKKDLKPLEAQVAEVVKQEGHQQLKLYHQKICEEFLKIFLGHLFSQETFYFVNTNLQSNSSDFYVYYA